MLIFKVGRLAGLLGVHRNTVTNWIKKGKLPAVSAPGRRYTVSRKAFAGFCRQAHIPQAVMEAVLSDPGILGPESGKPVPEKVVPAEDAPVGAVMVVGGGIAGIQAALELSDSGLYVYLVEKTAGIGGTMARLDKTFPAGDCAPCMLLPKLAACRNRSNIELLTLTRVVSVSGRAGRFTIKVKKSARYIDADKCIACGRCAQKCPVAVPDEFNTGISRRRAAYINFSQSVPLKYAIDASSCLWFSRKSCRACEKFCPAGAVNLDQVDIQDDIQVGAVILAPGFKTFDPSGNDYYGYPQIKDVVTSLKFECLTSAGGSNRGRLMRPSDKTEPRKIAWLQCVGSRSRSRSGNSYCSNICCMASMKQALAAGNGVARTIFFMDIRTHGKEAEAYFVRARTEGIRFVRALPHTLFPGKDGKGVQVRYVDESGVPVSESFDMLVLATGFQAPDGADKMARLFGVEPDAHSFAQTPYFEPVATRQAGIYVAGSYKTPVSIPRAVVQASAAASCAAQLLKKSRHTLSKKETSPPERDISGENPCVGVFICSCGMNISGVVDVDRVAADARRFSHVSYVENNKFSCSVDVQKTIAAKIKILGLNRIVIAACSPLTHGPMFRETLKSAGLNGYLVELANIRNQNAWVHGNDPDGATLKAVAQVRMAVAKAVLSSPLTPVTVNVVQTALVVGGGIAGMTAALAIAKMGIKTLLIEKGNRLGGNARHLDTCFTGDPVAPMLKDLIRQVEAQKNIHVYKRSVLERVWGSAGHFTGTIRSEKKVETIDFGAAVMATGALEATPVSYGYGKSKAVMTQMEFDRNILGAPKALDGISGVTFIQCVDSREGDRPYCSRICCIHSVKAAIQIKTLNPDTRVAILYREMRTYGEWEDFYKRARALGVLFIRYTLGRKPKVTFEPDNAGNAGGTAKVIVQVFDPLSQGLLHLDPDILVLASGVQAGDNKPLADLFRFSVNPDGFFNGAHPKLKPVDLSVAGLFLAGLCNYPKPMDESIEEARAAGIRAANLLCADKMVSGPVKAFVTDQCDGCGLCVDVCPFGAVSISGGTRSPAGRVAVDQALCQGCGICAATCGRDGILVHGFTPVQLKAQVHAAFDARGGQAGTLRNQKEGL